MGSYVYIKRGNMLWVLRKGLALMRGSFYSLYLARENPFLVSAGPEYPFLTYFATMSIAAEAAHLYGSVDLRGLSEFASRFKMTGYSKQIEKSKPVERLANLFGCAKLGSALKCLRGLSMREYVDFADGEYNRGARFNSEDIALATFIEILTNDVIPRDYVISGTYLQDFIDAVRSDVPSASIDRQTFLRKLSYLKHEGKMSLKEDIGMLHIPFITRPIVELLSREKDSELVRVLNELREHGACIVYRGDVSHDVMRVLETMQSLGLVRLYTLDEIGITVVVDQHRIARVSEILGLGSIETPIVSRLLAAAATYNYYREIDQSTERAREAARIIIRDVAKASSISEDEVLSSDAFKIITGELGAPIQSKYVESVARARLNEIRREVNELLNRLRTVTLLKWARKKENHTTW